jgi:ABC-type branched-subunit amino acid transport system permease subunit
MAELVRPTVGWPWWAAIAAALIVCALIGILQGSLITRIGLPSFVVTLAGLLFWEGVMLYILGDGGSILIQDNTINDIGSGTLTKIGGWVVMLAAVGVFAMLTWRRDTRRRDAGLTAPPPSLTVAKMLATLAAGVLLVLLCNADRGVLVPVYGMPWVVLLVFAVIALWTFVLGRLKFGRYVYAIGGNAEAARRAGINLRLIRTTAFMLCSFTAGIAGVVLGAREGSAPRRFKVRRCAGPVHRRALHHHQTDPQVEHHPRRNPARFKELRSGRVHHARGDEPETPTARRTQLAPRATAVNEPRPSRPCLAGSWDEGFGEDPKEVVADELGKRILGHPSP